MHTTNTARRMSRRAVWVTMDYKPAFVDGVIHVEPVRYRFKVAKVLNQKPGAVTLFPAPARAVEPIEF